MERENSDFDAALRDTMALPVSEVATQRVIAVDIHDDLGEVLHVLSENHLKKAPVLEGDAMVDIINRSNITKYAIGRYCDDAEGQ